MGQVGPHLSDDLLSALADRELDASAMRDAEEHVSACPSCAHQLSSFRRLDRDLAAPAPLSCAAALDLRSALLDDELSVEEAAIVTAHIASCASCADEQVSWARAGAVLRATPPAVPSAATDARVRRLTQAPASARPRRRGRSVLRPAGVRLALAVVVALALVVGLTPNGSPEQAQQAPGPQNALVASLQTAVLYTPTNTLYVTQPNASAVDALDASSYALRARIAVGGRPTALALNNAASRIIVLDAQERSIVRIDALTNTVVGSSRLPVGGTPTSVQVDPASGKIFVGISDTSSGRGGATTPPSSGPSGLVAVLDPSADQVETVKSIDVAPSQIVVDPSSQRTLVISGAATTVLDGSLNTVGSLPGGIAGAFGAHGLVAVLGGDPSGATVTFSPGGSSGTTPGPLHIPGTPKALTPMPDGGFAVLVSSGQSGHGRIVVIDAAGSAVGVSDIDKIGSNLSYDPATGRFAVVADDTVASASLPAGLVARPGGSSAPSSSAPATSTPLGSSPSPSAAPSGLAGPTASPSPSGPPSGSGAPSASPFAAATPPPPAVPPSAVLVSTDVYRISTNGRLPVMVAATPGRIWFLDQKNWLSSLNTMNGDLYAIAPLPASAQIRALAADARHLYALDSSAARLYSYTIGEQQLRHERIPLLHEARSMAVSDAGTIWVGLDTGQLFRIDPGKPRLQLIPTSIGSISAVVTDSVDVVWFTDGSLIGRYDLSDGAIAISALRAHGAARSLLPDHQGTLWVGTTSGEVYGIRNSVVSSVAEATRPVAELSLDQAGNVWSLSPAAQPRAGYALIPVTGSASGHVIPGPVFSLDFTSTGRAWLADASGGFYLVVVAGQR